MTNEHKSQYDKVYLRQPTTSHIERAVLHPSLHKATANVALAYSVARVKWSYGFVIRTAKSPEKILKTTSSWQSSAKNIVIPFFAHGAENVECAQMGVWWICGTATGTSVNHFLLITAWPSLRLTNGTLPIATRKGSLSVKVSTVHVARLTLFVGLLALSRILKSYRHIFNFVEEEQKTRNNFKK